MGVPRVLQWRNRNLERAKAAAKVNRQAKPPFYNREICHRYRARKMAAAVGTVDYDAIIKRDRSICGLCSKKVTRRADLQFDHIIPVSKQGAHAEWNIQVAHAICNQRKHDRLIGQQRLPF